MEPNRVEFQKQCIFQSFCKRVLHNEACNAHEGNPASQSKGSVVFRPCLAWGAAALHAWQVFSRRRSRAELSAGGKKSRRSCCLKQSALCGRKKESYHAVLFRGMTDVEIGSYSIRRAARYSTDGQALLKSWRNIWRNTLMNGTNGKQSDFPDVALVPYPVIVAATKGDPDAMKIVLQHFSGYIASLSMRKLCDERGNVYFGVDEDIRQRLQARLMRAILTFRAE